jgi:hypothetical protein
LLGLALFLILINLLFLIPAVQSWMAQRAASYVANKTGMDLRIERLRFVPLKKLELESLQIIDHHGAEVLRADVLHAQASLFNPFRSTLHLASVEIEGGQFGMHRAYGDSLFTFNEFMRMLSHGNLEKTAPKEKDPNTGFQVLLDKLILKDSELVFRDDHGRMHFDAKVPSLQIDLKQFDLRKEFIRAEKLDLQLSMLEFHKQPGEPGPSFKELREISPIAPGDWEILVDELNLQVDHFIFDDPEKEPRAGLDFAHLDMKEVGVQLRNLDYYGDTIQTEITQIRAIDKSGASIEELQAQLYMTNRRIELEQMQLQTPYSNLQHAFSMEFEGFSAFGNFEENVFMRANMDNSLIALVDLMHFTQEIDVIGSDLKLSGEFRGPLSNLKARDMQIAFSDNSYLEGRFDASGLPRIQETFVEFRIADLSSNASDLATLLPDVALPDNLPELGQFNFSGEFIGFPSDFVAYGNLQTAIGQANSDLNLKIDSGANRLTYSGNVALQDFDLAAWTDNEQLGLVSLEATTNGTGLARGLAVENTEAKLEAVIQEFVFREYAYHKLNFDGEVSSGFISGSLESEDPNFDQSFNGTIDLTGEIPAFDFESDFRSVDFYELNLSDAPLQMQARVDMNFEGGHIDSILGQAYIRDLFLTDSLRTYILDSLNIESSIETFGRRLEIRSETFDVELRGRYELSRLADASVQIADHYFPDAGLMSKDSTISDQDFRFDISIRDSKEFQRLIDERLGRIINSSVAGRYKSIGPFIDMRGIIPQLTWGDIRSDTLSIDLHGDPRRIDFFGRSEKILNRGSVLLPATVVESAYAQDSMNLQLFLGKDTDPDRLNFKSSIRAEDGAFVMRVLPSQIISRGESWTIHPNNSIKYYPQSQTLTADNFLLQSGEQLIRLSSLDKDGYDSWLDLDFEKAQIESLLGAWRKDHFGLYGKINGHLYLSNITTDAGMAANFKVDEFQVDSIPIGDLDLNMSWQQSENRLNFNTLLDGENKLRGRCGLHLGRNDGRVDANLKIERLSIEPFSRYLVGLFDQMEGDLSGEVNLTGTVEDPVFSGNAQVQDAALRLIYLDVKYQIPQLNIDVQRDGLQLLSSNVYDALGNQGLISGAVRHEGLSQWRFDNLRLSTDQMLFMDTDLSENPDFYGKGLGSGVVTIDGPFDNIDLVARASTLKGTDVTIPIFGGPSVSGAEYIYFINPAEEGKEQTKGRKRNYSQVNFTFFLNVTEDAEATIDLGDKLHGRGYGDLQLEINTAGDFRMSGLFTVTEGDYNFSLQGFLPKPFQINPGSTITWTGDPYAALLNVRAVYEARASEWSLISDYEASLSAAEIDAAQQARDILVYLDLTGELSAPNIAFDIEQKQGQFGGTSIFDRRLQQIKADDNELNKQVFGLLVLGQFIPQESGINPLLSGVNTSVSEFLSSQVSFYVSDWLNQFVDGVNVDIAYYSAEEAGNSATVDELSQQELEIMLTSRLLNDRIYVNVGGNFGVGQNNDANSGAVAGDFKIEYAITPDGRIRIKAFQRTDYDVIQQRNIGETGVGVFYSEEFDSIQDLINKNRERKRRRKAENGLRSEQEDPVDDEAIQPGN